MSILITDSKVIDFFIRNPSIDPNVLMVNMIDLYDFVLKSMSNVNVDQILKYILENNLKVDTLKKELETNKEIDKLNNDSLQNELRNMKDILQKLNNDINSSIQLKIIDLKSSYIEEIKNIINNPNSDKRIIEEIINNNKLLIASINNIIKEERLNDNKGIDILLKDLQRDLNNETQKIIENDKSTLNNIQLQLYTIISSSEARLTKQLDELRDNNNNSITLNNQVNILLDKFNNSSQKGIMSENILSKLLIKLYSSSDITDTSGIPHSCDIKLSRLGKVDILFENKNYTRNVHIDEVKKFQDDIKQHNTCGIMLSQQSGITHKPNFHIDIYNNNILLYLHNVEYNGEKIKLAVDIIDHLYNILEKIKLNGLSGQENSNIIIKPETVNIINQEYQNFIKKREDLIEFIRNNSNESITKIKQMEFPQLINILSINNNIKSITNKFNCKVCKKFGGETRKELNEHKKTCK